MKIKNDFVTNSSSTSFIVWGGSIDRDILWKNKNLVEQIYNDFKKGMYFPRGLTLEEFHNKLFEEYSNEVKGFFVNLDLETHFESYNILIGKSPDSMGEDQTLREFKNEIKSQLKDFGIVFELNFISRTWYDG